MQKLNNTISNLLLSGSFKNVMNYTVALNNLGYAYEKQRMISEAFKHINKLLK